MNDLFMNRKKLNSQLTITKINNSISSCSDCEEVQKSDPQIISLVFNEKRHAGLEYYFHFWVTFLFNIEINIKTSVYTNALACMYVGVCTHVMV